MTSNWHESNQEYLAISLVNLRTRLEQYLYGREAGGRPSEGKWGSRQSASSQWLQRIIHPAGPSSGASDHERTKQGAAQHLHENIPEMKLPEFAPPAALEVLCRRLRLTPFERNILLLCVGMEMDSGFAGLCAGIQDDPAKRYPTFSMALELLPEAHWSALTPNAPLRHYGLIQLETGYELVFSPLHIDEWTLHYLAGTTYLNEHLAGLLEPLRLQHRLVPSHRALAEAVLDVWSHTEAAAMVQLRGEDSIVRRSIAAAACDAGGIRLFCITADLIPLLPADLDDLILYWEREAMLTPSALLLEYEKLADTEPVRVQALLRLIERTGGRLIVSSNEPISVRHRQIVVLQVQKPDADEQRTVWKNVIGEERAEDHIQIEKLIAHFNLNSEAIYSAGFQGRRQPEALWEACRVQARAQMSDLAERIETRACWSDLILPETELHTIREIAGQVRQRAMVYNNWGLGVRYTRGLGISVLFAGTSGTGKTLAAEVLANELKLDLYRIDLSAVVSKYIGETEKNLRRIFDAAEAGGAVLLFDEADALFGKRSEVKDSHDRYANIEVSYLLQRMESYRGLAILTTNMKNALDQAFLRRLRFVVQFPFPDLQQRAEIWRRIYVPETPVEELDIGTLARMQITGGNISNIALNAAFLAAEEGCPIAMKHLLNAATSEYAKLDKMLTEIKIGGPL